MFEKVVVIKQNFTHLAESDEFVQMFLDGSNGSRLTPREHCEYLRVGDRYFYMAGDAWPRYSSDSKTGRKS